MKKAGLSLISLAFLVGAYLAVLDDTIVDWPLFAGVLVVGFTGVFLARYASRSAATSAEVLESNMATVRTSLANVVEHVSALNAEKNTIPTYDVGKEIDGRVLDDLDNFVEAREAISHTFGLQAYADVMSHYAGGERYLNRVWSASADGYVDEVNAFLEQSLEQFTLANDKLSALRVDTAPSAATETGGETRGW